VDDQKGYGGSITVDMTADAGPAGLRDVSIRGTVAEGILMVSRIDEFHKLYFEPVGPTAFFLYDDRPGVLGTIGKHLAEHGVNIEDVRNPHDPKTNRSLAIMKVNEAISEELTNDIGKAIDARSAFSIVL
jgi:D-3-phosphoglycerate dehydrogenase